MLVGEKLRFHSRGPRVVLGGECGTAGRGGMVVGPELEEGVWVWVVEACLAHVLEGADGGFLGVGDEPVDGFLSVNVGLVLEVAADGVGDGRGGVLEGSDGEQEDDESGEAGQGGNAPGDPEAGDEPGGEAGDEEHEGEGAECGEDHAFGDVMEDVVAGFVAEDEEDFVVGEAVGGGVEDDDALGCADAGDAGVDAV